MFGWNFGCRLRFSFRKLQDHSNLSHPARNFAKKLPLDIIFCVLFSIIIYLQFSFRFSISTFLVENWKRRLFEMGICFISCSLLSSSEMCPVLKPNSGTMSGNHSTVVSKSSIFVFVISIFCQLKWKFFWFHAFVSACV